MTIGDFKIFIITIYFHKQKIRKSQPDSNRYQRFSHLNYMTFIKTKQQTNVPYRSKHRAVCTGLEPVITCVTDKHSNHLN